MKKTLFFTTIIKKLLLMAVAGMGCLIATAQVCSSPATVIYGLNNVGQILPITVATGATAAAINPAYTGNVPSYANATGYNALNGKFYQFKRNSYAPPQEFVSFDPATNLYAMLAPSPATSSTIVNLGCVNNSGTGYYCLDATGVLYYYAIATNTWTTISSNLRTQFGTTIATIITDNNRIYGDLAFDGLGNMWMVISSVGEYGLFKINGPLPTIATATVNVTELVAATTPSPGGASFGGIAFSPVGEIYMSANSPDNRLYKMSTAYALSYLSTLSVDGAGNDLTSCNFPFGVLASSWISFSASIKDGNKAFLSWNITEANSATGYSIEYSTDNSKWNEIAFVVKTGNEYSRNYTYTNNNLNSGTHFYRIRRTDANGRVSYSVIKKLAINSGNPIAIWPNPAQDVLKVQNDGKSGIGTQILLCDQAGRMIRHLVLQPGINSVDIRSLPSGTYIVQVKNPGGNVVNQKMVKL